MKIRPYMIWAIRGIDGVDGWITPSTREAVLVGPKGLAVGQIDETTIDDMLLWAGIDGEEAFRRIWALESAMLRGQFS